MANSGINFKKFNGKTYLVDKYDQPIVYTTRFSAMMTLRALKHCGMDVEIVATTEFGSFYHIVKLEETSLTTHI